MSMNAVILFDSNEAPIEANYGHLAEELIFGSGIIQRSGERIVVRAGDLRFSPEFGFSHYGLIEQVLSGPVVDGVKQHPAHRAEWAYEAALHSIVLAVVLHGISKSTLRVLDESLWKARAYVGWKKPDFSFPLHQHFYRKGLLDRYFIEGAQIRLARGESLNSDRVATLESWGFNDIGLSEHPSLLNHLD